MNRTDSTSEAPEAPALTVSAGRLDPRSLHDLRALADAAEAADGNPPFSDQTWVELRTTDDPERVRTVTAWLDHSPGREGELAGAAVRNRPRHLDLHVVFEHIVMRELRTDGEVLVGVGHVVGVLRPDVRRAEVIAFKRSLRPPRSVTARHEKGLRAERERLLARLREIDILLSRKTIEATEFTVLQELDDEE